MQIQSNTDWSLVWGNLHNLRLSDGARSASYMVVNDIIATNVRWYKIRLMDIDNCTQCGRQDTTLCRLTECGVRREIWEWTRKRTARIGRMEPRCIPTAPSFRFPTVTQTKTPGDPVVWVGIWFFIWCINAGIFR